jgi:ankyrin repeat protein
LAVAFLENVFSSGTVHINSTDDMGLTALHVCALHGKTAAVKRLIELKANVNQESFDDCHTPLHLAAMRDHVGVANELVLAGAKVRIEQEKETLRERAAECRLISPCFIAIIC